MVLEWLSGHRQATALQGPKDSTGKRNWQIQVAYSRKHSGYYVGNLGQVKEAVDPEEAVSAMH